MKVIFANVGRNKKTWTAETECSSEAWILSQITKSNALMSEDINVDFDGPNGTIYAGMRPVGTVTISD